MGRRTDICLNEQVRSKKMEFGFKNFARAGEGVIMLNDLTVICGPNDTGKTYINYAMYSILKSIPEYYDVGLKKNVLKQIIDDLRSKGNSELELPEASLDLKVFIRKIEKKAVGEFHSFFRVPANHFSNLKISLSIPNLKIKELDGAFLPIAPGLVGQIIVENGVKLNLRIEENKNFNTNIIMFDKNIKLFNKFISFSIYNNILRKHFLTPFSISSERTGIALFLKVFDRRNNLIIDKLNNENSKISDIIESRADFSLPIRDNLNTIRDYEVVSNSSSKFTRAPQEFKGIMTLFSNLLRGGEFKSNNDVIMFHPSNKSSVNEPPVPLHATSSSVKSLFLFDLYLKHLACDGDLLVIDEPELNLFPANQAKMARLVARLVNSGIKVLVTTHSDYFIREINNLIALSNIKVEKREKLMNAYGFENEELLNYERVSAYNSTENFIVENVNVDKYGIDNIVVDSIIREENEKNTEIIFEMEDEQ